MRFMLIQTWEPQQRDQIAKKRMENGRLAPDGIKVLGEWLDASGGRQIMLFEADDALSCIKWSNRWSNLGKFECFPVVEVKDDKAREVV